MILNAVKTTNKYLKNVCNGYILNKNWKFNALWKGVTGLLLLLNCHYIVDIKLSQNENNTVNRIYFCDTILADKISYGEVKERFTLTICQSSLSSATWWQCPQKLYYSTNTDYHTTYLNHIILIWQAIILSTLFVDVQIVSLSCLSFPSYYWESNIKQPISYEKNTEDAVRS